MWLGSQDSQVRQVFVEERRTYGTSDNSTQQSGGELGSRTSTGNGCISTTMYGQWFSGTEPPCIFTMRAIAETELKEHKENNYKKQLVLCNITLQT